ncbi:tRNA 2-thiouridine(34) synthase MnmA [Halocola ammonii]
MKRVVVGLSGGVDSSVAAYLLQKQGFDVIGVFMRNWHDESVTIDNECPWIDDSNDAMAVAEALGIPFQVLDLSAEYKDRVVDYMFSEYENGRTPNPDVLCNREIKFDIFLKAAMGMKADFVATGHYCRKDSVEVDGKTTYRLLAGKDDNKDQSYFLCQLTQDQLAKALFPVGELQKSEVREIATELGLVTADKKDSQGLCFVGKVKLPVFLQQQLAPKRGKIIQVPAEAIEKSEVESTPAAAASTETRSPAETIAPPVLRPELGEVVGEHTGAHYFTIGQRKGLSVGGTKEPLFVIGTDVEQNIVYVGESDRHPGLYRDGLFIPSEDVHWIREDLQLQAGDSKKYDCRIRYRQPLFDATLIRQEDGLFILFDEPQKAVAPGQFAAWYDGDELVGSGIIS